MIISKLDLFMSTILVIVFIIAFYFLIKALIGMIKRGELTMFGVFAFLVISLVFRCIQMWFIDLHNWLLTFGVNNV